MAEASEADAMACRCLVLMLALGAFLAGCSAGARVVRGDERGGTVETWGPLVPATEQARMAMAKHCRGRFQLIDEPARGDVLGFACRMPPHATLAER